MEKFIIEKEDKEAVYLMYADEDGDVMVEGAYLTPYIEPDREKAAADAFQRGYEHAKHECADCRKIRADTEQELADNAYQRGLDDAWEAARKFMSEVIDARFRNNFMVEIFECDNAMGAMKVYSASECIEKIRQYEQGKEEIKVGDEVKSIESGWTAIVTKSEEGHLTLMGDSGAIANGYDAKYFAKTGRHFHEIAAVLEKMREDAT